MFKEDFVQIPTQRSRIPWFRPDGSDMRLDAHQCLKIRTVQDCIHLDVMVIRPDAHQSSTSNQISFTDTYMGRQLHPSGRQGNTVQTRSLIRQDVKKNYNCSDIRATLSGRGPYYGNYVQLSELYGNTARTRPWYGIVWSVLWKAGWTVHRLDALYYRLNAD
jgi:hypothetical protein